MNLKRRMLAIVAGAAASVTGATGASAQGIYLSSFESAVGAEWSKSVADVSPSGRQFLGQFSNEDVVLTLTGLPEHEQVRVEFDLYIIGTWDGNAAPGPDRWMLDVLGGPNLLSTTFAVGDEDSPRRQSYSGILGSGEFANRTGAIENNTLGFYTYGYARDAIWHLAFTFDHTDPTLALKFAASGLQQLSDESWGIDNVGVSLVPAPGAMALLGLGGLAALRRRR